MNVYDVVGSDGVQHFYLSPLPPEHARAIGALPREAIMGELLVTERPAVDAKINPAQFRPNASFIQFLNGVFAQHANAAPGFAEAAAASGSGFIQVVDARTATPKAQVPAEDIIGRIEIANGAMVQFHANESYRLLTERGFMRLHPWMHAKLIEALGSLAR